MKRAIATDRHRMQPPTENNYSTERGRATAEKPQRSTRMWPWKRGSGKQIPLDPSPARRMSLRLEAVESAALPNEQAGA